MCVDVWMEGFKLGMHGSKRAFTAARPWGRYSSSSVMAAAGPEPTSQTRTSDPQHAARRTLIPSHSPALSAQNMSQHKKTHHINTVTLQVSKNDIFLCFCVAFFVLCLSLCVISVWMCG